MSLFITILHVELTRVDTTHIHDAIAAHDARTCTLIMCYSVTATARNARMWVVATKLVGSNDFCPIWHTIPYNGTKIRLEIDTAQLVSVLSKSTYT